jgi:hypothetical protein
MLMRRGGGYSPKAKLNDSKSEDPTRKHDVWGTRRGVTKAPATVGGRYMCPDYRLLQDIELATSLVDCRNQDRD